MNVTIIIPTFNDWDRLWLCLSALAGQTYPQELYEIIVVNNNPADKLPADYTLPLNCTIITEGKPGSYSARNAALKLAKGDIIGFTDSDCIPLSNWIASAIDVFNANPDMDRIAGNVVLFFSGGKPNPAELYESVYAFQQESNAKNGVSVTANMFSRKKVFESVGPFNENLLSGGDIEWSRRAKEQNFRITYSAQATVKHPARKNLKQMAKKSRRIMSGKYRPTKNSYLKESARLLFKLRPSFKEWAFIGKRNKELSFYKHLQVFGVKWYLDATRIFERFRLLNGGKPYNDI